VNQRPHFNGARENMRKSLETFLAIAGAAVRTGVMPAALAAFGTACAARSDSSSDLLSSLSR
jgi:hypothetical protein